MDGTGADAGMTVVTIEGPRLDVAATPGFRKRMADLVEEGERELLLDFSNVEFVDSSGLGAVVGLLKLVGRHGRVELTGLRPAVRKVFRLTRMDQVFPIHEIDGTG